MLHPLPLPLSSCLGCIPPLIGLPSLRFYAVGSSLFLLSVCFCLCSLFYRDDVLCWLLLARPFLYAFHAHLRFPVDLVWFRLSCDHGWIRSGSVNVRKQQQLTLPYYCDDENRLLQIDKAREDTKFIFSKLYYQVNLAYQKEEMWHLLCGADFTVLPQYTVFFLCVFFPFILDIKFVGRTSRGHTGFFIHLLSAVRALIFLARRIQPSFLSLVDREVEFCVLTTLF